MNYRLSSEFFEKYKKVVDVILNSNWEQEVDGLSIEFICYHYQFVVENVNYAREEKYKINSSKEFINKFQLGKITSQELINNSLNFMNEQRVDFVL